jgi:hypothetical protein
VATDALASITHKIAGDAGQLGWLALTDAARGFLAAGEAERAVSGPIVALLLDTAARSLVLLRQRLESARSAAKASATLA